MLVCLGCIAFGTMSFNPDFHILKLLMLISLSTVVYELTEFVICLWSVSFAISFLM